MKNNPYEGQPVAVASFLSEWDAILFCGEDKRDNLFINRELDGKYHVYDGGK